MLITRSGPMLWLAFGLGLLWLGSKFEEYSRSNNIETTFVWSSIKSWIDPHERKNWLGQVCPSRLKQSKWTRKVASFRLLESCKSIARGNLIIGRIQLYTQLAVAATLITQVAQNNPSISICWIMKCPRLLARITLQFQIIVWFGIGREGASK